MAFGEGAECSGRSQADREAVYPKGNSIIGAGIIGAHALLKL